jgi:hypothetical protein
MVPSNFVVDATSASPRPATPEETPSPRVANIVLARRAAGASNSTRTPAFFRVVVEESVPSATLADLRRIMDACASQYLETGAHVHEIHLPFQG